MRTCRRWCSGWLNFPNWTDSQQVNKNFDQEVDFVKIQAKTTWQALNSGAPPIRYLIACGILPASNIKLAAREVGRVLHSSRKTKRLNMHALHSGHWTPLFEACSMRGNRPFVCT